MPLYYVYYSRQAMSSSNAMESLALPPGDLQLNRMFSLGSEDITLCMALGWLIRIERRVSVIGEFSVDHLSLYEYVDE